MASLLIQPANTLDSATTKPPNRRWASEKMAFSLSSWIVLCQVADRPTTSDGPFRNSGSDAISAGILRSSVHAPRTTDPRASSSTIATFIEFGAHATSTRDSPEASLSRTSSVLPLSRSTKDMLFSARIAYLPLGVLPPLAWQKGEIKGAAATVRFLFMNLLRVRTIIRSAPKRLLQALGRPYWFPANICFDSRAC